MIPLEELCGVRGVGLAATHTHPFPESLDLVKTCPGGPAPCLVVRRPGLNFCSVTSRNPCPISIPRLSKGNREPCQDTPSPSGGDEYQKGGAVVDSLPTGAFLECCGTGCTLGLDLLMGRVAVAPSPLHSA